jgi:hypothetical protein
MASPWGELMRLNEVLFYGRPAEVLSMAGLSDDLQGLQGCKVMDCPGGPSSQRIPTLQIGLIRNMRIRDLPLKYF